MEPTSFASIVNAFLDAVRPVNPASNPTTGIPAENPDSAGTDLLESLHSFLQKLETTLLSLSDSDSSTTSSDSTLESFSETLRELIASSENSSESDSVFLALRDTLTKLATTTNATSDKQAEILIALASALQTRLDASQSDRSRETASNSTTSTERDRIDSTQSKNRSDSASQTDSASDATVKIADVLREKIDRLSESSKAESSEKTGDVKSDTAESKIASLVESLRSTIDTNVGYPGEDLKEITRAIEESETQRKIDAARKITEDPAALAKMRAGLATGDPEAQKQAQIVQAGAAAQAKQQADQAQRKQAQDNAASKPFQVATQAMNNPIGAAISALPAPVGAMAQAVQAAVGAIQRIVSASMKYVEALNPTLVKAYNSAFRDLQATIGIALTPVVNAATVALRQIGSVLLPLMQRLNPVVERVTQVFQSMFRDGLKQFETMADAIVPLISAIVTIREAVSPIIEAFQSIQIAITTIIAGVVKWLAILIESLIKFNPVILLIQGLFTGLGVAFKTYAIILTAVQEVFFSLVNTVRSVISSFLSQFKDVLPYKSLKEAFLDLAKFVILAAARIAKFLGITSFLAGLEKGLGGERQDNRGTAAAQNTSFTNFAELGRQIALSAALAGQGASDKPDEEALWRSSMLEELRGITSGEEQIGERILAGIRDAIYEGVARVIAGLQERTYEAGRAVADRAATGAQTALSLTSPVSAGLALSSYLRGR